jgi:Domain of unknown function (DUF4604)
MSKGKNKLEYGMSAILSANHVVQEEPAFLRRMREGFSQDDHKKEVERKRRRGSEEVIDQDEAPQVVIREKDKDVIDANEARAFVVEKEGVKIDKPEDKSKNGTTAANVPKKPREENVSLGMMKKKKAKEGGKKVGENDKDSAAPEKSRKPAQRKEKRLKLSFEED